MIVSVHTPKTAGISFSKVLKTYYGERLYLDYGDYPINKPVSIRLSELSENRRFLDGNNSKIFDSYDCIHGHFMPYKYMGFQDKDVKFVTWLRDPLERLASHYHFWFRAFREDKAGALHRKVVLEKWSLEKFCFSEEMKNLYNQFFWSFPLSNFNFIGITEYFDSDLRFFCKYMLRYVPKTIPHDNINPQKGSYFSDQALVKDLMDFHSIDYEIYNEALIMRRARIQ